MTGPLGVSSPTNRVPAVDRGFLDALERLEAGGAAADAPTPEPRPPGLPIRQGSSLSGRLALELLESAIVSRHVDFEARAMKARGEGFYTIGSAGHEANAALAAALRPTDPALLHYRSGAFFVQRGGQVPGETPAFDLLLSIAASTDDPISGGRHKVYGSARLAIPPQTSTIASHLPKALGLAVAIERARRLGRATPWPADAIVLCSFGDAGVNHASAATAFNAARYLAFQGLPAPVLFVCEDNGIGISVPTPRGWVRNAFGRSGDLAYFEADGRDLAASYERALEAVRHVRGARRPAFLRLETVRLLGHAGSDVETTYRSLAEIEAEEARDPLVAFAEQIVGVGVATAGDVRAMYEETRRRVAAAAREAARRPKIATVAEVMAPLAPFPAEAIEEEARRKPRFENENENENENEGERKPRHMGALIPVALAELCEKYPEMLVFGEDVAKKGGVYHATADLQRRAGKARVFDTLLDETMILGLAMGFAQAGFLPCPEIQYLAYVHNALDQLRGEACSLQYFSDGRFRNPMVVRIAGLGYQKGFGGHFHNDNSTAALRDIPGLIVACPARGDDAVRILRSLFAAAKVAGRVSVCLEPIALYMQKDLHEKGDDGWCARYPAWGETAPIGRARVYRDEPGAGDDLAIVTYGNGVFLGLRAARALAARPGVRARVIDLRWLRPLDEEAILAAARATRRVLVVDEGRRSGGVAEPVLALLAERLAPGEARLARVAGADTYIPLGDAALACMPSEADVIEAARAICR